MKRLFKKFVIVILLFGTAIYLPSCKKEATPPVVKTTTVSGITETTASIEGNVTDDGGTEIIETGICWSTTPNPTVSSNKTNNGKGTGLFTSSITGLTANTRYYVRAYAINSAGISYGNQISFVTIPFNEVSTVPNLITAEVISITSISAISGGTIKNDGGEDIIDKGIMWSTIPEWSDWDYIEVTLNSNGPGSGSFVNNMSGLTPGTTYFVKAYATNSVGIAFGPTLMFTTAEEPVGTGIRKTDFPPEGGRYMAAGFSIGSKIYLGLGYDWDDNNRKDLWEYDPATNGWTQKADFPGTFTGGIMCFAIGTKGYIVILNYNYMNTNSSTNDLWEYNPATNDWTQKASIPSKSWLGSGVAFSIGTKGFVGSGYNGALGSAGEFWEWDQATNVWTKKDDYPGNSTDGAVGFSIGTKGYIGTGRGYDYTFYKDFWEWDQATNVWTKKADFGGMSRGHAVGFSIGNKAYIGTGGGGSFYKDFWEWDQATNVWTKKADFGGSARTTAIGFSIGNKGYIGTGMGPGFGNVYAFKDLWEYDPNLK